MFRKVCAKIIRTIAHNTKRCRPRFRKNQKLFLKVFGFARHLKRRMKRAKVLIVAFQNQRRQNPTLQSNKNRYSFMNINLSNFSQHLSDSQLEKQAKHSSLRRTWAALNVVLRGRLIGFGDIGRQFSKICTETIKKNVHNPKPRKPGFRKKSKAVFEGIRFGKTSQTQDVKSQMTKRSLRNLAQPKRDSAFEQKTRIVPSREI